MHKSRRIVLYLNRIICELDGFQINHEFEKGLNGGMTWF